jgi:hypothetical protein
MRTDQNLEVQTKTAQLFEWSTAWTGTPMFKRESEMRSSEHHFFQVVDVDVDVDVVMVEYLDWIIRLWCLLVE